MVQFLHGRTSGTGAVEIVAPSLTAAGYDNLAVYTAYSANLQYRLGAQVQYKLEVHPNGIYYRPSENYRFEFRYNPNDQRIYIIVNGTEYPLCIGDCGSLNPPGGGPPGGTPSCSYTSSSVTEFCYCGGGGFQFPYYRTCIVYSCSPAGCSGCPANSCGDCASNGIACSGPCADNCIGPL